MSEREGASAPERVAEQLREDLFEGTLPPGSRVREVALGERFGVGRHTVRAALQILAAKGLVVHERHRGAFVPELTQRRVDEAFEFRTVLEVGGLRLALGRGADFSGVEAAVIALEALPESTPWRQLTDAHRRIHREIVACSGNSRMVEAYKECEEELQLLFAAIKPDFSAARLGALHRHLLEALRVGGDVAVRALDDDINLAGRPAVLHALNRAQRERDARAVDLEDRR